MKESTKDSLRAFGGVVAVAALLISIISGVVVCESRAHARTEAARGSILYGVGEEVTIKMTGERTIVTGVYGYRKHWRYCCRVAFGRKNYPSGVVTNPTQITHTYELVDFYGFELEAR